MLMNDMSVTQFNLPFALALPWMKYSKGFATTAQLEIVFTSATRPCWMHQFSLEH